MGGPRNKGSTRPPTTREPSAEARLKSSGGPDLLNVPDTYREELAETLLRIHNELKVPWEALPEGILIQDRKYIDRYSRKTTGTAVGETWAITNGRSMMISDRIFDASTVRTIAREGARGDKATGTPVGVIAHEIGHILWDRLGTRAQTFSELAGASVSKYPDEWRPGTIREMERFAEGFAALATASPASTKLYADSMKWWLRAQEW